MRLDYIDASPLTSCETNCASTNGYAIFSRVTHSAHSFTFIRVGASICAMCIRICPMPSYMTMSLYRSCATSHPRFPANAISHGVCIISTPRRHQCSLECVQKASEWADSSLYSASLHGADFHGAALSQLQLQGIAH